MGLNHPAPASAGAFNFNLKGTMTPESQATETRIAQFNREFPRAGEHLSTNPWPKDSTMGQKYNNKWRGRFDSKQAAANVALENKLKGMA